MSNQKQISWHRNKVFDFLVKGYSQYDIASIMKLSQATINRDLQILKKWIKGTY